jgi:tetratricopeptide (TPR) repeat protein
MSRRVLPAALGAALLVLAGCAATPTPGTDVLKQIQAYESAQEYGQALDLIAAVPSNHPQRARVAQKKPQIEAKARLFEQNTQRRADELAGQNRWSDALGLYRDAIDKLPRSQALRSGFQDLQRRQDNRVKELTVDQLVGKARWLERSIAVQQSIVNTDPEDSGARRELDRLRESAGDVARELTRIGVAALQANNLGLAGRALPIASRLAPNKEAEHASNRLGFQEAVQENNERAAHEKALKRYREQEGKKLFADFQQAFRAGDLRRAHIVMSRMEEMDGDNPEVVRESQRLHAQLDKAIDKYMDDGNSLYGRGKFKEAMAFWNKVLELEPDHEAARNNLDRAARVVEKLKQLREEQAANPAPATP